MANDFNDLPEEITLNILSYLNVKTLSTVALINKKLNAISRDHSLWKEPFKHYFPNIFKNYPVSNDIAWHTEFHDTANAVYRHASKEIKEIILLIKKHDTESILKKEISFTTIIKSSNQNSTCILTAAQQAGDQKILDYLYQIAQAAFTQDGMIDVRKKDNYNRTILDWAIACQQNWEHIKLLMSNQPFPHPEIEALDIAAKVGNLDVVRFILEADTSSDDQKLLRIAALHGHINVVNYLLQRNADLINQPDKFGHTPLFAAIIGGKIDVVDYLLRHGANPNIASNNPLYLLEHDHGKTPLHYAAEYGYIGIVDKLIQAGAIIDVATMKDQCQPIHLAIEAASMDIEEQAFEKKHNIRLGIVHKLLEIKPNLLEQTNAYGQTLLLLAVKKALTNITDYLISKGANLDVRINMPDHNKNAGTILHYAAITGRLDIVQTLIENKPHLFDQADAIGQSPLAWAVMGGKIDVVKYLIDKGANPNATIKHPKSTHNRQTLFDHAMEMEHYGIAKILKNAMTAYHANPVPNEREQQEYALRLCP